MKKSIIVFGAAMLMLAACKKDAPAAPATPPTPPPVENPAPPPAPKPRTQAVTPVTPAGEQDGTSVSFDENGVSIKDKDGKSSKSITVSKTKKEIKLNTN